MSKFQTPPSYTLKKIEYLGLRGIDLSSDLRRISHNRASDCINVYRKYSDSDEFIETRPGFNLEAIFPGKIYGMYYSVAKSKKRMLVHAGEHLYYWRSFPNTPDQAELIPLCKLNETNSSFFSYNDKIYINDGENYLVFDGVTVLNVLGYVPTTRIASTPLGDGETYQAVNLLSSHRKNSFRGDGVSTEYMLDCTDIDGVSSVFVNQTEILDYTVDIKKGSVTFKEAPPIPNMGNDNVIIEYYKLTDDYKKISGCLISKVFDNRVFFAGNKDFPNVIFHSSLNDPTYIADTDFYEDGSPSYKINAILVKDNCLIVLKESGENSLFKHTPMTDYTMGRIYPASEVAVNCGCDSFNCANIFRDDSVYLSHKGLEGIGGLDSGRVYHRSSMVDSKLNKENFLSVCEWNGYLCILCEDRLYLADSKARFSEGSSYEYEWFIWNDLYVLNNGIKSYACFMASFNNDLYFGTVSGEICKFSHGTNDMGRDIISYWQTRSETADDYARKKTMQKDGCVLLLKKIPNSNVEVWFKTDENPMQKATRINMGGLNFSAFSFLSLSFSSGDDNLIPVYINARSFKTLTLKFCSNSCFGIGRISYLVKVLNYI